MKYNFDQRIDRHNTFSTKWDGADVFGPPTGDVLKVDENTISVWTADMDFACPDSIREEIQKVVDRNLYGYSAVRANNASMKPYFDAIAGWFKRHYDWEIAHEDMTYSYGTVNAIKNAIQAFSEEGDGILITQPVYSPFMLAITSTKRKVVNSSLINNDGYYTVDFEDFEKKAADPKTKLFVLCNPHNPVGRVWTADELKRMYDICTRHNVIVAADEIHGELIRKGQRFFPLATLVDGENLITFTAPNKTFNVADLAATTVVITNPELKAKFRETLGFINPNIFTIAATIGAYNGGEEWLEQVRDYIDGNIDWIMDFVAEKMPRLKVARPEGTYIMWMDFRGYGLTPDEVNKKIAQECNVVLERGEFFGEEGTGFQRICVPVSRCLIQEIFERFYQAFEK